MKINYKKLNNYIIKLTTHNKYWTQNIDGYTSWEDDRLKAKLFIENEIDQEIESFSYKSHLIKELYNNEDKI